MPFPPRSSSPVRRVAAIAAALLGLVSGQASAQTTFTWDGAGGDNLWSTGVNWVGDAAPSRNDSTFLTFAGSTRTSPFNDAIDWQPLAGLTFASGASGFRIEGNAIGFVNGSGQQVINQNATTTQEINTVFSFGSNQDSRINLNAGDLLISAADTFIDSSSSATRSLTIAGTDSTRRTITYTGNLNKSFSGNDPDMYIQNNKRVLASGTLKFGGNFNENDAAIFIDDGVLQFSGAGTMSLGSPAVGNTSGSANAALLLDTAGATFARQVEIRGGSSGQRIMGGVNTSGTVTFSGNVVATNSPSDYDLKSASGGAANFSGTRNFNAGLRVNRADADGTYGGTVLLSGTTSSNSFTRLYAGTLQFSDFNQLGTDYFEFDAASGDSGTLRYTGGSTTTTKTLWLDNTGITRAAIDVSGAGTTLTWDPGGGARTTNLTKTGAGWLFFRGGITGGTVGVEGGLLVLTASNSYSGGTTVTAGTLEVSAGGAEGGSPAALGTGTVSIASGGQVKYWLSLSGSNTVANHFSLSGGTLHTTDGYNTYSGRVTLASGSSTISAQYEDTITLSGGLAGVGNVLFTQTGGTGSWAAPTYVLSGTGANTGTVRVSGSSGGGATKLQLTNVNALQNATLDMATDDAGTIEFYVTGNQTYALGGLQGTRNLAFGGNSLSIGGNGQSTTYSGTLSGGGSLTKLGSGTLTLSAANTYSGTTTVAAGRLALGAAGVLADASAVAISGGEFALGGNSETVASLVISSGTLTGAGTLTAATYGIGGGTVAANIGSGTVTVTGNAALDGTSAATALRLNSGTLTLGSGGRLAAAAALAVTGSAGGGLVLGGNETFGSLAGGANVALGPATLTVGGANTSTTFSGGFTGAGRLVKEGGGTLTLSGSSGMTGPVDVTAGTIQVSGNGVPGGSPFGLGSGTVSIAAGSQVTYWLDTGAGNTIANPFVISGGTLHTEDGGNIFTGRITLAGGTSSITGRYNDFVSVSGGLSGTGSVVFGQQGDSGGANAPTFLLSGTGTMTGTVRVTGSAGGTATTLMLISQQALQNATLDMAAGDVGTVDFTNGTRDIGGLMGSRDISPTIASLNVGGNGASTEYSGRITMGSFYTFTKSGTGTLTLSGSNGGLAGPMQVTGGRLEIGPTGSINATSGVTVSNGSEFSYNSATPFSAALSMGVGTLSGTGTLATQVFLSTTNSVVSPGNSPGILTFGTSQAWSAYSYLWELNDYTTGTTAGIHYDRIAITGGLNLNGSSYVLDIRSLTAGNLPGDVGNFSDVSRSWTILTTTGGITGFNASEWTLLTDEFSSSPAFTGTWSLSQVGNDLVLATAVVPEPSAWALALAGLACGCAVRRRRERRSVACKGVDT